MASCFTISILPLFVVFISLCFLCWCWFLYLEFGDYNSPFYQKICKTPFTEMTSSKEDIIISLILFGATCYPTAGLMIILVWLNENWGYITSFLPCVIFVW